MGFRINTNIASLLPQRELLKTTQAFQRTLQRLASGQRVNSARDDAAGLAIATGLDSQLRGVRQAIRNMNDAYGFMQIADGTLAVQADLVQRMRELSMQAANGTLSNSDRQYLNSELQQLVEEFNRITNQTTFNGTKLIDGSFETQTLQVGSLKGETIDLTLASMQVSEVFDLEGSEEEVFVGTGTFQTRTTVPTASWPYAVVAEDFNNDGTLDIVTADYGNNICTINFGNGNGTFSSSATVDAGGSPFSLTVADLNSDGALDLITPNYGSATASIVLGNGNGTFKARTTIPIASTPPSVIAVDLDKNGTLDLISAANAGSEISISLGNGDGTFQTRITAQTGTQPSSVITADLNNDGSLDIVTAEWGSATASVILGNGNGTFKTRSTIPTGSNPLSPTAIDLNNDGALDLVIGDYWSASVTVSLGNGNGTFKARTTIAAGSQPKSVVSVDLNQDGASDLVWVDNASQTMSISLGNGNGTFKTRLTEQTANSPNLVIAVDLNGDDALDLLNAASGLISINLGNGNGTFQARTTLPGSSSPLITADLNQDGVPDLLNIQGSAYVGIYLAVTDTITETTPALSLDISTQSSAQDMLEVFDGAMTYISSARSTIGALQSRLDYAQTTASTLVENIAQSRSQILDADMAQETAEFSRYQILQQAQVAVLSQANLNLQMALSLLRSPGS